MPYSWFWFSYVNRSSLSLGRIWIFNHVNSISASSSAAAAAAAAAASHSSFQSFETFKDPITLDFDSNHILKTVELRPVIFSTKFIFHFPRFHSPVFLPSPPPFFRFDIADGFKRMADGERHRRLAHILTGIWIEIESTTPFRYGHESVQQSSFFEKFGYCDRTAVKLAAEKRSGKLEEANQPLKWWIDEMCFD